MDKLMSGLNGIFGFLLMVIALVSLASWLGFQAWKTQRAQVTQSYKLDYQAIRAKDPQNIKHYILNPKETK